MRNVAVDTARQLPKEETADNVVSASWRRSEQSGLDPTAPMDPPVTRDVNLEGRLFRAAAPVLARIRREIAEERLSVMLVDGQAEMLATVNGCPQIDVVVERIGATPGALWREDTTGTNALATPFETRQPLFVRGREHYVERLKDYSCYGAPILNPVNGRLVGVLDVMSDAGAESGLMRPFIDAAVAEIQENMRQDMGYRTLSVMKAFEDASRHPAVMVVAISKSMVLQSSAAAAVLSAVDLGKLRELAEGVPTAVNAQIELSNGQAAQVHLELVEHTDGVVMQLQSRRRPFVPRHAEPMHRRRQIQRWIDDFRTMRGSGLIVGEHGTGRTTALNDASAGQQHCSISARLIDPADAESELYAELDHAGHDLLVLDDLDALPPAARSVVSRLLLQDSGRVLAGTADADLRDGEGRRLLDLFDTRVELPPLRALRSELVSTLNLLAGPGVRFRFSQQATRMLESYSWPGNLRELSSVIRSLAKVRGRLIDLADLPQELRNKSTAKAMTPWQQASCDAIMRALELSHGNKAHAADYLGISRSTLYHHIREYGIAT